VSPKSGGVQSRRRGDSKVQSRVGLALLAILLLGFAVLSCLQSAIRNPQSAIPGNPQSAIPTNPRVGFYQWVSDVPATKADLLTMARERVKAAGSGLMRLYVGPRFDYIHPLLSPDRFPGLKRRTPVEILGLPYYRAVLEDPDIHTVILTAYPAIDYGAGPDDIHLMRPWTAREEREEHDQIRELAQWLLERYGAEPKTFIISNTEADDKLMEVMNYTGSPEMAIENLRAWQNTRYQAVDEARRLHPNAQLKLQVAFEISFLHAKILRYQGRFVRRSKGEWNALADVVPQVRFDLLSYSSYESTNSPFDTSNINTPPEDVGVRLLRDLRILQKSVQQPVMIGELGIPYDQFDRLPTGGVEPRLAAAIGAIETARPEYVVFWQVFDAPSDARAVTGFGWLDARRATSPALLRFIAGFR
jgi:hypothetical protein